MIKLKNLTKTFNDGQTTAVDNISLTVGKGQIACFIGTSGCGKTTTLKMINRLIPATSGYIEIGGKSFQDVDSISWRRRIGYVIQKAGLLPHMTVRENIEILSKILKKSKVERKKRSDELMNMVGLLPEEFADRYPAELSGGQAQRVGVARALMEDPDILLMDEPFGALDPITRHSVHDEFLQLNKKLNKTIMIVTHDMNEAFKLADIIIVMDCGKIIQAGSKAELLNSSNNFVKDFLKNYQ